MDQQNQGEWGNVNRVLLSSWLGPRTVVVPRTELGFGFTLRHFVVYPPESAIDDQDDYYNDENDPDGWRHRRTKLSSLEPMDTIFVKNVKESGPAQLAGLRTGDRIVSVNGEPVTGKSYAQVISLIQGSDSNLKLLVVPKDEDILQMAYQSTAYNCGQDPYHGHSGSSSNGSSGRTTVRVTPQPYHPNPSPESLPPSGRERKTSSSSLDSRLQENMESRPPERKAMTTSSSYLSGLSVYREPVRNEGVNRNLFQERKKEFEIRAMQENHGSSAPPSKTYSFGLFFPTPKKDNQGNTDNQNSPSGNVVKRSKDNVLQPNDSQDNISKSHTSRSQAKVYPLERRMEPNSSAVRPRTMLHSQDSLNDSPYPKSYLQQSSSRHSYPDAAAANQVSPFPRTCSSQINISSTSLQTDTHSKRQYVPVVSQSPTGRSMKISSSLDNIDSKSNIHSTERQHRSSVAGYMPEHLNQNNSSRTFIFNIGGRQYDSNSVTPSPEPSSPYYQHKYGTTFAVTRSPITTQLEIRKSDSRPLVSHRKKQFESVTKDNGAGSNPFSKYRTEVDKITSMRKFNSLASRMANFEKSDSPSRKNSVPSSPTTLEPTSNSKAANGNMGQFQDSPHIRIYVSQGTSNTQSSPIVEIVPVSMYQDHTDCENSSAKIQSQSPVRLHYSSEDAGETAQNLEEQVVTEEPVGMRSIPVRKASFLSAVNAPHSRYLSSPSEQSSTEQLPPPPPPPPHSHSWVGDGSVYVPPNSSMVSSYPGPSGGLAPTTTGETITSISSPVIKEPTAPVILRRKAEESPEDEASKFHRRISYLMATAKDRSQNSERSVLPQQQEVPEMVQMITPAKNVSMRKLKSFFGEKTPRILEATEKRNDPASPLQDTVKEGTLCYKTDITDGKRSSDRSWKPVWVVLRGHALYLYKDRKESSVLPAFSFDENVISIKSSIVDIAHGYTKKKNVFRLKTYNGSEFLFQAEDPDSMKLWIQIIQSYNDPDADEQGVANSELIIRKTAQQELNTVKSSPPATQKMTKKLSSLSFKPKIPHSPNVKRRKAGVEKDDSKAKTWKGKLKSFRKMSSSPSHVSCGAPTSESMGMFSVPLEDCVPSPHNEFVPLIVHICTEIVEARGMEVTGIYRVPGNTAAVTMMQEELNKGIEQMNLNHEKWCDVNVISSLLKSFFRKLPEPLVTNELYQSFINANRVEDPERRMLSLKRLLHELPDCHFETFQHLAEHLNKVAHDGQTNKMDARNLAIVFGPTIIRKSEDDMVAMVADMSDQCRIIESIILHCDWFFSSWTVDNYVPVDSPTDNVPVMTGEGTVIKVASDTDSINPRDIVYSIVEAANKKLQNKSAMESVDGKVPPAYNERDIDSEIIKRSKMKTQTDTASKSSPNLAELQRGQRDSLPVKTNETVSEKRMAKSQEFFDTDFMDWEYIDANKDTQSVYVKKSFARHHSEDALLDKNDELEISHGLNNSYSLSRDTLDSLRRIEMEARALREREEKRRREKEKRRVERQRIEQDIQRTQRELELEESHSVEDLLQGNDNAPWQLSDLTSRMSEVSPTSDYSNTSYGSMDVKSGQSRKFANTSDYCSFASPQSVYMDSRLYESPHLRGQAVDDVSSGGKYFVSIGNTVGGEGQSQTVNKGSSDSLSSKAKRTNSLENVLEAKYQSSKHRSRRRKEGERIRRANRDSADMGKRVSGNLSRSSSMRRGSLDSLIDLLDRRASWASTDSEDGSDLLASLTSTFDQKLQVLVNPKYKLNGSTKFLNKQEATVLPYVSGKGTSNETVESERQNRLPVQAPLSQCRFGLYGSNDMLEKRFQDPSLHRSSKSETKIGIASRFQRNPPNTLSQTVSDHNLVGRTHGESPLSSFDNNSYNANSPIHQVLPVSQPQVSDSRVQTAAPVPNHRWDSPTHSAKPEFRPVSKLEKTEVNITLSKLGKEDKHSPVSNLKNTKCSKSSGKAGDYSLKSMSASPPPRRKNMPEKRKRRHTVGGSVDSEHFKAVLATTQSKEAKRLSAWEQLQPVVRDIEIPSDRNVMSWLKSERLRGSTPDLSFYDKEAFGGKK